MGCVRGHAKTCAWYHHYHVPHPRRGGFRTRPYETHTHGTHTHGTRPYGTHIHETRPYEIRIHGTRIHGTCPYGTTICTQGRMCIFMCIFGEIVNGVMHLNEAGHIVAWTWQGLPNHVPNGIWDAFVVMPNPVHGTIIITSRTPVGAGSEPAPTKPASTGSAPATKSYGLLEIVCQFTRAPLSLSKPCLKKAQTNEIKTDKQGR